MCKVRPLPFLILLPFVASLISCGTSRQLQSISISNTVSNGQISFFATGTFSSAPTTVTPLPVNWVFEDPTLGYALTTQPFVLPCKGLVGTTVAAMAPVNPHAPSMGLVSSTKMVVASVPFACQ